MSAPTKYKKESELVGLHTLYMHYKSSIGVLPPQIIGVLAAYLLDEIFENNVNIADLKKAGEKAERLMRRSAENN